MPIAFDVDSYGPLKTAYKKELKARGLYNKALRFKGELSSTGQYSDRDCWLLTMSEFSKICGLIDPIPEVRGVPAGNRREDKPQFEMVTDGKAMSTIPTPEEKEAQQTHGQIEPLPLSDMQWVYSHIGENSPPCVEFPPPSKGAVGLFSFAKSYPDKFYAMFLKMVEKKMAEEEIEIASEREALSSVEQIKSYLSDLEVNDEAVG